jgi:hypothetical protein
MDEHFFLVSKVATTLRARVNSGWPERRVMRPLIQGIVLVTLFPEYALAYTLMNFKAS